MRNKILIDAFGGDNSPLEILKGVEFAKGENKNLNLSLVGNERKIKEILFINKIKLDEINIINCETEITNNDHPTEIFESKKGSSMAVGLSCLASGEFDVFVSAGNSGALLVGTSLIVKRAPGVRRIAFAPFIPKTKGDFLFLDAGANAQCTPEILVQFAHMANDYLKKSFGILNPKVALLNIGSEEKKGDSLRKETHEILKKSGLNFIGNIEPDQVFFGDCNIVVTDGFCGNIFLKTIEGAVKLFMKLLKNDEKISEALQNQENVYLNPKKFAEVSYATLLGANHPVIKLHSSIDAFGLCKFLTSLGTRIS